MSALLHVLATGPLATVQDLGRPGLAHWGVGVSGAADRAALRRANRLLGNGEGAAAVEVTFGGLALRATADVLVALTGAPCAATVDGRPVGFSAHATVCAGAVLRLGAPMSGLRTYVAVRGGIDVPPVLGSRATDVLAGLGPPVLAAGAVLPVGAVGAAFPATDLAPVAAPPEGEVTVRVRLGPRDDWFADTARTLVTSPWISSAESNRIGLRLEGTPLRRSRDDELPSEGMVRGAVQVPPSGMPTVLLADHPVTGGYPVVAVVLDADADLLAQVRPGQAVRFAMDRRG